MGAEVLLEARDLTMRFGKLTALDGLELVAPAGKVLAILGPNGAGKTTFVRAVATLLRPSRGTLAVYGIDVAADPTAVRRVIGLAGQFAAVEPTMTGRENLVMIGQLFGHHRKEARRAASAVIDQLGLAEVADRRAGTYSGGQRRRLDLGASLVGAPRLLLLDEPTTGLDPTGRAEVWAAVSALVVAGTDVLLTTHYLDEANHLADHIVVIDHGRVIAAGTLSDLKSSIGGDVIEVILADVSDLGTTARLLDRVTANPPRMDPSDRRVIVPAPGGVAQLRTVIDQLHAEGTAVEEIGLRRRSLDEVFAALTATEEAEPVLSAAQPGRSLR